MSRYTLEEEEQIASLKAFWTKYGNWIMAVVIAILAVLAANNGYKWWKSRAATQAVVGYESIQDAAAKGDLELLKKVQASLLDEHKRTPYAERGAIVAARAFYDAKNLDDAEKSLKWVVENGQSDEYVATAKLTLAGLYIELNKLAEAKTVLSGQIPAGFEGLFHDRLGDIALAGNDVATARTEYGKAMDTLQKNSPWVEVVKRKQSALPADPTPVESTPATK